MGSVIILAFEDTMEKLKFELDNKSIMQTICAVLIAVHRDVEVTIEELSSLPKFMTCSWKFLLSLVEQLGNF